MDQFAIFSLCVFFLVVTNIKQIQNEGSITKMIGACRAARSALDLAGASLKPGMTTDDIDKIVHEELIGNGAYPSPLHYRGGFKKRMMMYKKMFLHIYPVQTDLL